MAALAASSNSFSKLLAFGVLLYSTRIALPQLGPTRFGVWMTISSVATLLSFMDLGLSNVLIGRVAELNVHSSDRLAVTRVVTVCLLLLSLLGLLSAGVLCGVFALSPLGKWFHGIDIRVVSEARVAGYVFAAVFGLSLPVQGISKVYIGLQKGWVAYVASSLAWVLSGFLVYLASRIDAPMWYYALATYGTQQIVGAVLVFGLIRHGMLQRVRLASWRDLVRLERDVLVSRGGMFLIIQLVVSIIWGSNQFILSAVVGPIAASTFSVLQRIFMLVTVPLSVLNAPLWPAYAEARAQSEAPFLRGLLWRSMLITFAGSVAGGVLIFEYRGIIVRLISNGSLVVPAAAMLLMAVWAAMDACGNAFSMYLNGVGVIRPQALLGLVYLLVSVPLKVVGATAAGLQGLLVIMIATYVALTIVPLLTIFRRLCLEPLRVTMAN